MNSLKVEPVMALVIYFLIGVPALYMFSVITPVFHVPDEPHHFMRAYQVSNYELFPQKRKSGRGDWYRVGGRVDKGILKVDNLMTSIAFDPNKKLTDDLQAKAGWYTWYGEKWVHTPNVSIYPPFFYIPAAIGISLSKMQERSIVDSVTFSRWCNIALGVVLVSWAILLSGESALLLCALLLLPMTLSQMASVSQDALMIPTAALLAAFLGRLLFPLSPAKVYFYAGMSALAIILLSTSRPPYAALALVLLLLAHRQDSRNTKAAVYVASMVAIFCSFLWAFYVAKFVSVPFGSSSVSYSGQISFIIGNPIAFLQILWANLGEYMNHWLDQMVGVLGWLDTPLPSWYYDFTLILLGLLVILQVVQQPRAVMRRELLPTKIAITGSILIGLAGLLTVMYIGFSPVGGDEVRGVQGRYFLPLFMTATLLGKSNIPAYALGRWHLCRYALVCLIAATGVPVALTAVFTRFYS